MYEGKDSWTAFIKEEPMEEEDAVGHEETAQVETSSVATPSPPPSIKSHRGRKPMDQEARKQKAQEEVARLRISIKPVKRKAQGGNAIAQAELKEMEDELKKWRREYERARNALNHRKFDSKSHHIIAATQEESEKLYEMFLARYDATYRLLLKNTCPKYNDMCPKCQARTVFADVTRVVADNPQYQDGPLMPLFQGDVASPKGALRKKEMTDEEFKSMKRERNHESLKRFRKKQQHMVKQRAERLAHFSEAIQQLERVWGLLNAQSEEEQVISRNPDESSSMQSLQERVVRCFTDALHLRVPRNNIALQPSSYFHDYLEYLSIALLLTGKLGVKKEISELCGHCKRKKIVESTLLHLTDPSPSPDPRQFSELSKAFKKTVQAKTCEHCMASANCSRITTSYKLENGAKHLLLKLAPGKLANVGFPGAEEIIADVKMKPVFVCLSDTVSLRLVKQSWRMSDSTMKFDAPEHCLGAEWILFEVV